MKISKWGLKYPNNPDDTNNNNNQALYKKIEITESTWNKEIEGTAYLSISLMEKNVDPKFYAKMILSPVEAIKFGCRLVCLGIEALKWQSKNKNIPKNREMKGFDECVFFIKEVLEGKRTLSFNKNS